MRAEIARSPMRSKITTESRSRACSADTAQTSKRGSAQGWEHRKPRQQAATADFTYQHRAILSSLYRQCEQAGLFEEFDDCKNSKVSVIAAGTAQRARSFWMVFKYCNSTTAPLHSDSF
jgi:hypothetical protein